MLPKLVISKRTTGSQDTILTTADGETGGEGKLPHEVPGSRVLLLGLGKVEESMKGNGHCAIYDNIHQYLSIDLGLNVLSAGMANKDSFPVCEEMDVEGNWNNASFWENIKATVPNGFDIIMSDQEVLKSDYFSPCLFDQMYKVLKPGGVVYWLSGNLDWSPAGACTTHPLITQAPDLWAADSASYKTAISQMLEGLDAPTGAEKKMQRMLQKEAKRGPKKCCLCQKLHPVMAIRRQGEDDANGRCPEMSQVGCGFNIFKKIGNEEIEAQTCQ